MTLIDQNKAIDVYSAPDREPTRIMCDMQPYSGSLAQEEYGLDVNCVMRLYTKPCDDLKEGALVAESGGAPLYIVKYAEPWDDYTMALLSKIPAAERDGSVNHASGENSASDIYGGGFY